MLKSFYEFLNESSGKLTTKTISRILRDYNYNVDNNSNSIYASNEFDNGYVVELEFKEDDNDLFDVELYLSDESGEGNSAYETSFTIYDAKTLITLLRKIESALDNNDWKTVVRKIKSISL